MSWIVFPILSSILWGLFYAVTGEIVKRMSIFSAISYYSLILSCIFFAIAYFNNSVVSDWNVLKGDNKALLYIIILALSGAAGYFCMFTGVKMKTSTAVAVIEVSYPLFTALFTWIIFRENHLSFGLIFGGILIASGILCVMHFDES